MAKTYTYDDFKKALAASGLSDQFSDADLKLAERDPDAGMSILSYKQDYNNATTDEARALANAGANEIRSKYGQYTAGTDGTSYYKVNAFDYGTESSPSSFTYTEPAPTYKNTYGSQVDDLMTEIMNQQKFEYDPSTDPLYSSYKKTYTREGQRATEDVLGDAAAMTGGIPSSYAVTAAAQQGNYYASQLADKVPELYEMAYSKYLNEYNQKLDRLDMLSDREQFEYSQYLNDLDKYESDRNFSYAQWLDELEARANEEAAKANERQAALSEAYAAAEYGDFSLLQALGINPDLELLAQLSGSGSTTSSTTDDNTNTTVGTGIDEATLAILRQKYPDGVITDKSDWNSLVSQYGEDALTAAGYSLKDNANVLLPEDTPYGNRLPTELDTDALDNTWTTEKINNLYDSVGILYAMKMEGNAEIKTNDDIKEAIREEYPQYAGDAYFEELLNQIIKELIGKPGDRQTGGGGKINRVSMSERG